MIGIGRIAGLTLAGAGLIPLLPVLDPGRGQEADLCDAAFSQIVHPDLYCVLLVPGAEDLPSDDLRTLTRIVPDPGAERDRCPARLLVDGASAPDLRVDAGRTEETQQGQEQDPAPDPAQVPLCG